jgi:hypothetical protein
MVVVSRFPAGFVHRCGRNFYISGLWLLSALASAAATLSNCDETSLRQAITTGGTITFACDGTITLSAPLIVERDTVLDGSGRQVTLSGGNAVRVLEVNPGVRFSIRALTIANGRVVGTNGLPGAPGQDAFGAGVLNRGSLTLVDCFFRSNVVRGGTGGPDNLEMQIRNGPGGFARGAAIDNDGAEVWATNCVFTANSCTGGNGGFNLAFSQGGDGGDAFGGAFFTKMGAYAFSECRFLSNLVNGGNSGGSQSLIGLYGNAGSAYGGAIGSIQSTGVVVDGVFIANQITGASLSWNGVESGEARGGAVFNDAGRVSIFRTLVASNRAVSGAAARNGAGGPARGGGVANSGELTMTDSLILGNAALAGLATRTSIFAFGGGLDNGGTAIVARCTFQANEAVGGPTQSTQVPAPGGDAHGGAAYSSGTLFCTNCTFVGNVARGGDFFSVGGSYPGAGNGGALAATGGSMVLSHVTIGSNVAVSGARSGVNNAVPGRGGGIYVTNNTPILQNSILAYSESGSNAFGVLVDAGNNISSDASCQFTQPGSRNNVDPRLSPLADFGGPTPTMALLTGSPAIDAALPSLCVPTDQRGRPRPWGSGCDVGAFESSPPFTVRGTIHGFKPPQGIVVQCDSVSGSSDVNGNYIVFGVDLGSHNLVPTSPDSVVMPNSKALSVSCDLMEVDFKAYRFNGLAIDAVSDQDQTVVLAGQSGDIFEVQTSQGLAGPWTILSTNTVGPNGIVTFQAPSSGTTGYLRAQRLSP